MCKLVCGVLTKMIIEKKKLSVEHEFNYDNLLPSEYLGISSLDK